MRQETFKFWDLMWLISEVWQYKHSHGIMMWYPCSGKDLTLQSLPSYLESELSSLAKCAKNAGEDIIAELKPSFFFLTIISPQQRRLVRADSFLNSLWPSDAIWRQRSGSTFAQVMACYLMAPSHYLNQCWLIIGEVPWHSSQGIIIRRCEDTNQ